MTRAGDGAMDARLTVTALFRPLFGHLLHERLAWTEAAGGVLIVGGVSPATGRTARRNAEG